MDISSRPRALRARTVVAALLALALAWTTLAVVDAERADAWGTTYVAMAERPTGGGRWLLRSDGGIEVRGSIPNYGDVRNLRLNGAPLDIAATPSGRGYWILGADGGVFSFGDARFHGSTGAMRLNKPIVGMAPTPTGNGYWLVATDGGIFTFGDARFHGSTGAIRLNQPIIDIAATASGDGYWLTASDGGVFTFGRARYVGAGVNRGSIATSVVRTTSGYAQLLATGEVLDFPGAETLAPRTPPVTGPHTFLFRASDEVPPARWNACAPVRIEVNYAGSGQHAQARQTLQAAIDQARAATGLDIRIVGETGAMTPSSNADAIIRWDKSTSEGGIFPPGYLGFGGGSYHGGASPRIVSGVITFNGSVPLSAGFGGSSSFGVLALHELGHMLGLGHVLDTAQVMYPSMRAHSHYGNGDREGLWWLGAAQGCTGAMSALGALSLAEPEPDPIPFGTWD